MSEKEIILIIRNLLLGKKNGENELELVVEPLIEGNQPDMLIKAGKRNIAVIEIVQKITKEKSFSIFSVEYYFIFKIRYFIYTNGSSYYVFDRFTTPLHCFKSDADQLIELLSIPLSLDIINEVKKSATSILMHEINGFINIFPRFSEFTPRIEKKIRNEMKISFDYTIYFEGGKSDIDSFEHQLFIRMLDNRVDETLYRYCSFERSFQILSDETIAMQGLPGMNDTTEPNYVDNYINDTNNEFWELASQSIETINRRFIMSCTVHYDNLLQWRLYGDDAKGVCIKFETKETVNANRFYLGKVKYANEFDEHPELNFIKQLRQTIRRELYLDLKLVLLFVWRHFFKPREYDYEGEVRLLYIHQKSDRSKKWIIVSPYSIINPMVVFNLKNDDFPLKISEVMLGPKLPELQINKAQLKQMLSEKNSHINVTESSRNVYRST